MGRDGRGVTKASDNSIQITFQYRGERCREKLAIKPIPANLKRAEQHRAAILHTISAGVFDYAATFPESPRAKKFALVPGQALNFGEYLSAWLSRQKQHLKSSSFNDYRKIVDNLLIPRLGAMMLSGVSRKAIREMLDDVKAGNKRLANIQSVLRNALASAVDDDLIEGNPLYGWTYARQEPPKSRDDIDPFTPEEQASILAVCPEATANLVQFMLWSGLRTSEMIALDWADIDFHRKVIIVDKAMTNASKGEAEDTKTRGSTS